MTRDRVRNRKPYERITLKNRRFSGPRTWRRWRNFSRSSSPELRRKTLGDEDPRTLTGMHNPANALVRQANHPHTLSSVLGLACETSLALLGEQHPDTQFFIRNAVTVYEAMHSVDPDAGHDQRAAHWQEVSAKLSEPSTADEVTMKETDDDE